MSLRSAYPSLAALFDDELKAKVESWRRISLEMRIHASGLDGEEKWQSKQIARVYEDCAKELEIILNRKQTK